MIWIPLLRWRIDKLEQPEIEEKRKTMEKQIGKVSLDYTFYPGEDLYCDGAVEEEILSIAKDCAQVEYQRIIEERKTWPVLYHLSPLRENIVDWLPITKTDKVLEVGSGCGAITGKLAQKAESVTCIDLSSMRSQINAYRHQELSNIRIHVGNFQDIEKELPDDFDYICLIGVFEYGQSYIGTDTPYEDFLRMMRTHLKPEGRIVIAIENKLGLKYFAGCKEDHLGTYFAGIEDYTKGEGVRTFTRNRLEQILWAADLTDYVFYYPYPDYKFMTTLFSDDRLPQRGELSDNSRNFDRDRMLLFDEKQAFDGIIKDDLFPVFSNSYVIITGVTREEMNKEYVKYSNDRAPEYAVRTEILRLENGMKVIRKHALSDEAKDHIRNMEAACRSLQERFEGGQLSINRCSLAEDGSYAEFAFVDGVTLEELLDECLERNDLDGFHQLFAQYMERIAYREEMPVSDYDLIFANILVNGDEWTVIDYEWTFGKPMSAREIAFRAIYCYILEDEKRNKLNLELIFERLALTEKEAESFREQEMEFQKFVTGKHLSMAQMRELIGHNILKPANWIHKFDNSSKKESIQVYEDRGTGFREEDSYFVKDAYSGEHEITLSLLVDGSVNMLRIDPAMDFCAVRIKRLAFNGKTVALNKKNIITNGKTLKEGSYVFETEDPNLYFKVGQWDSKAENVLEVLLEIVFIPETLAGDMAGAVKKLF